jgi:hypothetical protein
MLQDHYNGSLLTYLKTMQPDHEWLEWKFIRTPKSFWKEKANQRKFLEWAAKQLKVNKMEDWHRVSIPQLRDIGGTRLMQLTMFV